VIHVEAFFEGGLRAELRREIQFDSTAVLPAELARLRALVQRRTLELELWDEMQRTRQRQLRVIELDLEQPAAR
jgi:hypothetical protein